MVAEKIDLFGFGIKFDGGGPLIALPFHFHGLIVRDPFADVVGAAVGSPVEDPPDTTTFLTGIRGEGYTYFERFVFEFTFHLRGCEEVTLRLIGKEMFEHKP